MLEKGNFGTSKEECEVKKVYSTLYTISQTETYGKHLGIPSSSPLRPCTAPNKSGDTPPVSDTCRSDPQA